MLRRDYRVKNPFLLILLLAGVILCMILLRTCSHPGEEGLSWLHPHEVKSGGDTIDVAIEISPLSYYVSADTMAGLDYELFNRIARMSGRAVKYHVFSPLPQAVDGLNAGRYDVVISALPSTQQLKENFSLTDCVYIDRQILVQLPDAEKHIDSALDLADDTVWVAAGSPFTDRIENLSAEIGRPIYIVEAEGHSAEHLVMLVATGVIPRAVISEGPARQMKQKFYPDLDINTPVGFSQFQTWIVAKDKEGLLDTINIGLERLKASEEYTTILKRYGLSADILTAKATEKP